MAHTSIVMNSPCELINITPVNPLISKCQIKVCYIGKNRNHSEISRETAIELAKTLPGSPIVGFYNTVTGDFEEHNRKFEIVGGELRIEDPTKPYGFVDLNAPVWFQDYLDDGVVHTYLVTEGWLWTGQYPEAKRILSNGNNQSMELDEESLNGSWTFDDNSGMEFFIINEAIISKLCILGEDYEPCFEGASIGKFTLDKQSNFRIYSLMKEVLKLKGGELSVVEDKMNEYAEAAEVVEPVVEEAVPPEEETAAAAPEVVEAEPETEVVAEKTSEEEATEEVTESVAETAEAETANQEEIQDESVQFSLEDFQNLQESYSALEANFNDLQSRFDTMEAHYNALVEFKNTKDREAKQAMIDSFYMLSDEEKKDVQDNIDNYSLDDIEAKLSVICVHNKLDLSEKSEDIAQTETTFSLEGANVSEEEENVPAWLSLLRKAKRNNI